MSYRGASFLIFADAIEHPCCLWLSTPIDLIAYRLEAERQLSLTNTVSASHAPACKDSSPREHVQGGLSMLEHRLGFVTTVGTPPRARR